ncbi:response regulator transcription factor [Leucobacter sp. wl10]|uniref:response regulator n=1 Tax=Leucobacter sp. wl10 TaxID=2304677 RepID=UPI000E5A8016|nr:response regulator transcription factor [Leucobacter sp. wl10]RGE22453.1 DNA-binding response regulator [Leucobacter sp. wl10]
MTIGVMIVDDQSMIREGLRLMLQHAEGIEQVAEAADGVEALRVIEQCAVDVALVDIRMPRMDGPTLIAELRIVSPRSRCVVLTTFDDDDLLMASLKAGAHGYLLKDATPAELVDTIRRVHSGQTVLGSAPTEALIALAQSARSPRSTPHEALTPREEEVLELLMAGLSNREIASRLFLSTGSVKNHVTNVLRKFNLQTRMKLLAVHAHVSRK